MNSKLEHTFNEDLACSTSTSDQGESETYHSQDSISSFSKKIKKNACRRDRYNIIPNDIRLALIDAVINKGQKIKRAATKLGINYSSAKSIFQVYKREGRADKKSSKKDKQENTLIYKINPDFTSISVFSNKSPMFGNQTIQNSSPLSSFFNLPKQEASSLSKSDYMAELNLNALAEKLRNPGNPSPYSIDIPPFNKSRSTSHRGYLTKDLSPLANQHRIGQSNNILPQNYSLLKPSSQESFPISPITQSPKSASNLLENNLYHSSLTQVTRPVKTVEDTIPPLIPPLKRPSADLTIVSKPNNDVNLPLYNNMASLEKMRALSLLANLEEQKTLLGVVRSLNLYNNLVNAGQDPLNQLRSALQPYSCGLGYQN